jgi:hypothetical protein
VILVLALGAASVPGTHAQGSQRYAVVVSPDVPVSNLSTKELHRLFVFSKRFWAPSRPVTVLYSDDSLAEGSFLTESIYDMNFPSIRRLILEKLYQGELDKAPKVVANDGLAVDFVASGRGLIALVRADAIGDAAVKVLRVDGHAIDAGDYPLRR